MTNQTNVKQLLTYNLDIWLSAETEKKSGRGRARGNKGTVYGMQKLREMILELAVRGKLVPKSSGWKELKLGEIGKWAIGSGFPTEEQGHQNEDVLFAKVSDMNLPDNEKFIVETNNKISYETAKRLRINIHSAGTVIFPKIGGAIATNKRRVLIRDTAIDNNCLGLIPREGVSTDWLFLQLLSMDLTKYQAGTSVPALSQGVLQEIEVLLPNLHEQNIIVTKVDELMALCDQLEQHHSNAQKAHETLVNILLGSLTQSQNANEFQRNWQRIAEHFETLFTTQASIDALKQTLLQLAVMGKLVPQDPNDEPTSELLKRIKAEKTKLIANGKIKKEKPLAPISHDEKQFELPKGWDFARLRELVTHLGDGLHGTPVYDANGKYYFVNGNNLKEGKIIIKHETKTVDVAEYEKYKKPLNNSSILVSINGTLGTVGFYDGEPIILGKSACYINLLEEKLSKYFVKLIIDAPSFMEYALKNAAGTTIKNLGLKAINEMPLALPPLAEQHRIVAKVDAFMALCDQLSTRIQQASQQKQLIADALVAQAVN